MRQEPVPSASRRRFLTILALGGGAAAAWKLGMLPRSGFQPVQRTRVLMGTMVNLTVVGDDVDASALAADSTLQRMAELEMRLTRHRDDSDVGRLNRTGRIDDACDELLDVLRLAERISEMGGGAFDVTIKPVVDLYQRSLDEGLGVPDAAAIDEALELVDYRSVRLDDRHVSFARPGMALTLDGIAKGYVVDAGVDTLRERGFANVLVEAGGDLVASGGKPGDVPWTIGIRAPRPGLRLKRIEARNRAVATSGDYMQPFTTDLAQHHIIDPRTGRSSPALASSTVVAPTAAMADGLATLTMVLDPALGRDLIEPLPECEAYFVSKDLAVTATSGFELLKT